MGKDSGIEWTHHTFNPWWGCAKVSDACTYCYAETWAKRVGQTLWGLQAPRRFFGDSHWREPIRWNAEAVRLGERRRVFCSSMADVFEDRRDLDIHRDRLWALINATPMLDWLLLTKRTDRVEELVSWRDVWPENVWLGSTAESQKWADIRVAALVNIPARVRFLSCEPLLERVDLSPWVSRLDWVITGGESGGKARPMRADWARALRDQCQAAGVAFHFKQWGNWRPHGESMERMGKKAAGRELDGRTWDEYPALLNA
jgi:protein gp37